MKILTLFTILAALIVGVSSCHKEQYFEHQGEVFHTRYSIKYKSSHIHSQAIDSALQYLNNIANPFDRKSLIFKVNNNLPQWRDSLFIDLFERAIAVSRATGGYYDITVGPLVNVWGFGYEATVYKGNIPENVLDSIRDVVGFDKVCLRGDTVFKDDPRISLDMASIAKGYASDLVARALEKQGIADYMVEIGGEIAYAGVNPNGEAWRIGINKPTLDTLGIENGSFETILHLEGKGGLATSGNYRNYKINEEGTIYAHTIDPIEGRPVQRDVLSATILAPDCASADALATACMVMGSTKALAMVENLDGVECFLLVTDSIGIGYHRQMTDGIKPFLTEP